MPDEIEAAVLVADRFAGHEMVDLEIAGGALLGYCIEFLAPRGSFLDTIDGLQYLAYFVVVDISHCLFGSGQPGQLQRSAFSVWADLGLF